MIKVFIVANIKPDLEKEFLQHLRDFDIDHPGCHFELMFDAPDKSLREIVDLMRINPKLTFAEFFGRNKE